jgi:hypothetical protein
MFRVVLECTGVPSDQGETAALDITHEFAEHRLHHQNVKCSFAEGKLTLTAENDFDPRGLALMDEFSDSLSAFIRGGFDGHMTVKSVSVI